MDTQPKYVIQLMWHINDECNLCCLHCYDSDARHIPVDRWNFQRLVVSRIRELQEHYDIIRVGLLGGEPLFDPNVIKIISALYDCGIKRVDISTNGILANQETALQLAGVRTKMVQVSLEGPSAEINDRIRGPGSFVKAVAGLKCLQRAGIETGIMMTVSQFNLPYLRLMLDFAHREGVKIISFNRMLPIGRGKKSGLTCLQPQELREMIGTIHDYESAYPGMDISSDDPLLYVPMAGRTFTANSFGGCGAGIGNLAICHDGTVYPCRRLPIVIGNVNSASLIDIISSSSLDCFYNRRESLKGACRACPHCQTCGGCRAAAYAFTGDYLNPDPQCWNIIQERR